MLAWIHLFLATVSETLFSIFLFHSRGFTVFWPSTLAVICGTDKRYADEVGSVVRAARDAGVAAVYLAGPEKAVGDLAGADRPDEFLTAKINAVQALSNLLTRLGA